jgi:hypothetical protein
MVWAVQQKGGQSNVRRDLQRGRIQVCSSACGRRMGQMPTPLDDGAGREHTHLTFHTRAEVTDCLEAMLQGRLAWSVEMTSVIVADADVSCCCWLGHKWFGSDVPSTTWGSRPTYPWILCNYRLCAQRSFIGQRVTTTRCENFLNSIRPSYCPGLA